MTLTVNGQTGSRSTLDQGYAVVTRDWTAGDRVLLHLPMPVRRVLRHDPVEADRGRVALQRGPIVYAAEWPDNPQGHVRNLLLTDGAPLAAEFRPGLLNGVEVITGTAVGYVTEPSGKVVKREQPFTAIPYFAWANRGAGEMAVWIPDAESAVRALPRPRSPRRAMLQCPPAAEQRAVNDQAVALIVVRPVGRLLPLVAAQGHHRVDRYTFPHPSSVSEATVYWYDDTGHGEVRVPASWRILYKDGGEWKPVTALSPYGVAKDAPNRVQFSKVTTSALRLEATLQPEWSGGVLEWTVR